MKRIALYVVTCLMVGALVILLILPDFLKVALPDGLVTIIQKGRSTTIYAMLLGVSAIIGIIVVYLIEFFKSRKK